MWATNQTLSTDGDLNEEKTTVYFSFYWFIWNYMFYGLQKGLKNNSRPAI